jgi:hypothetical protein
LTIDDPEAGAERGELRCQREPGRTGPDDQDISRRSHRELRTGRCSSRQVRAGLVARTCTDQNPSATGWESVISTSVNPAVSS